MTRLLALVSVVLSAALLAACGGDDGGDAPSRADFDRDFNAINERLLALGDDIGTGIQTARGKSNQEVEDEFSGFSDRLNEIEREYNELEPPDDVKPEYDRMQQALATSAGDLREMVEAIERRDSPDIRNATATFVRNSPKLRDARRALARKTGGRIQSEEE